MLDVGCSFGYFLQRAREAGFRVAGIEPDAQAYARAREVLGEGVVEKGFLSRTTAKPGSADLVATLDVLEHIEPSEQADFAALVARSLVPSGYWVLKVPTTEGLYYKLSYLLTRLAPEAGAAFIRRMWQTEYEFAHTVYFDRRSLACWLNRHGFEVVDWEYLPEVPSSTVIDRLTTDGGIPTWKAYLLAPAVLLVNLIESMRGRSDALLMAARRR